MELEQRIKALEYELKILKNEIQRTLLDIQVQVLTHYYPTLRAEDTEPSEGTQQALDTLRAKQVSVSPPATPVAKRVSLDEIRAAQRNGKAASGANAPGNAIDPKLSGWVDNLASRIGRERAVALIEGCVRRGILAVESKAALTQIASHHAAEAPGSVSAREVLPTLLNLYTLMGRTPDVEEALALIEEAGRG